MIAFENKEKVGIKTDSKFLCLDNFENVDTIYKNEKINFRGKTRHSALDILP